MITLSASGSLRGRDSPPPVEGELILVIRSTETGRAPVHAQSVIFWLSGDRRSDVAMLAASIDREAAISVLREERERAAAQSR
jgi:hypothetical protein